MQESMVVCCGTKLRYYTHGSCPRWLIHSGTHGDEWGVIAPVEHYLRMHTEDLPDFIFVPEVSPSAVQLHTRRNAAGNDVNRMFTDASSDIETRANQALMYHKTFDLFLSFHEDPDRKHEWYLFDTDDAPEDPMIRELLAAAAEIGVTPYSGPDEPGDPYIIQNGYFSDQWDGGSSTHEALRGQATVYAVLMGIAKRGITLEIPGQAAQDVKNGLVAAIFQHFIASAKRDE